MKFKIGEKYTIQFWDHCKGDEVLLCEITLWVTKDDNKAVYGTWWRILDSEPHIEESNREMVSILKSTIVKKRKLLKF